MAFRAAKSLMYVCYFMAVWASSEAVCFDETSIQAKTIKNFQFTDGEFALAFTSHPKTVTPDPCFCSHLSFTKSGKKAQRSSVFDGDLIDTFMELTRTSDGVITFKDISEEEDDDEIVEYKYFVLYSDDNVLGYHICSDNTDLHPFSEIWVNPTMIGDETGKLKPSLDNAKNALQNILVGQMSEFSQIENIEATCDPAN